MKQETEILPEEVVVAVLHKVGTGVRLVDNQQLAEAFDHAADDSRVLRRFRRHPQYLYSERLSVALQVLDLGGSIIRENAPTKFFTVSQHTAGPYGESVFNALDPDDQEAVERLASRIKDEFGA